jgi:membrane dipeptidase
MLDRGYTKEHIHKVLGGNIMRVFAEAEKVSREWGRGGP